MDYFMYRWLEDTNREENLRKVATLLSITENADDPEVQAAIFEEVGINPTSLTKTEIQFIESLLEGEEIF
jgi:hypothetical protein